MSQHLRGMLRHMAIRLGALLRDPAGLAVLAIFVFFGVMIWPGFCRPDGAGWVPAALTTRWRTETYWVLIALLWLYLWPAVPIRYVAGRVGSRSRGDALSQRAMPSLPISAGARTLADGILLVSIIAAVRLVLTPVITPHAAPAPWTVPWILATVAGGVVILPVVLTWACPAGDPKQMWLRPLLVVLALYLGMRAGLLSGPWTAVPFCLALSAIPVILSSREVRWPRLWATPVPPPSARSRRALPPERQFAIDLWMEALRRHRWWVAAAMAILILYFLLAGRVQLPMLSFLIVTDIAFVILFVTLAFRPIGTDLIAVSLTGIRGYQRGDFVRAWSQIPVRREVLLRGIYRYSFLIAGALWGLLLTVVAFRAWLVTGHFRLVTADGSNISWMLVPVAFLAPLWAGFLTNAAVGDRPGYIIPGISLLYLIHAHPILSMIRPVPDFWTLAVLALVSGLWPLRHLYPRARTRTLSPPLVSEASGVEPEKGLVP